ncbi:uncharacterized protein ColSpa_03892 [Colletotrichum spaethianum]|uniref:Uncharacterized protein n=1 Tax=Colletotrichum spaethianum TaxID=700344 RepID=A0AA37L8D5_9PEZI|nr:uncharacterized protein ColSpa_03892 [Colletotrichum spaethianum]GKT43711.1 hypothetical protein ColSpa_03892 [Colletotrichum spaethianum]
MEHPLVQQREAGAAPRKPSSASSSKRHSKVDSAFDAKNRSSADTTMDSTKSTNRRSIRSVLKVSWGKTVTKILGKWDRQGATPDAKPASGPDAINEEKCEFVQIGDKQPEELLSRPDSSKLPRPESVTVIDVTALTRNKNRGLPKRRSLGNFFGSVRSRNTLKKRGKSPEGLAGTIGSSLSTQSPAKESAVSDNAPPTLPKLPPSEDLRSSFQENLKDDSESPQSCSLTPHPRDLAPTRPPLKDQAVQTPLTSIAERTDAKGKGKHNPLLPGMVDLRTGHELMWKTSTNSDVQSVHKCNVTACGSEANCQWDRTRPETEVTKQLKQVSPIVETADPPNTTHTRDLIQIPRIARKQEVRRSLKGDQAFIYAGRKVYWVTAANNRCGTEASSSAATPRDDDVKSITAEKDIEDPIVADTDIIDVPQGSGGKNLKRKAKSLTFVRQLEVRADDSPHTAPRRMTFKMDLRGTDSDLDGPEGFFSR